MSIDKLTPKEKTMLETWQKQTRPTIGTLLSSQLFELFLNGVDCHEIAHINKGIAVEQVLDARIRDGWDRRRDDYLDNLFGTVVNRVAQSQAESAHFLSDLLAVARKEHGTKLRAYLLNGKEGELPDFRISGVQSYKTVQELLLKVTGQDRDRQPGRPAANEPPVTENPLRKLFPAGGVQVLSPADAASILGTSIKEE